MSDTRRFLIVAKDNSPNTECKLIPDTKEELAKAVEEGFIFRTPFSFSEDPRHNPDCIRYGDMLVEFIDLHNPLNAVQAARDFMLLLEARFDVAAYTVAHFLGCDRVRLVVPATIIGSSCGDKDLPLVYHRIVKDISDNFSGVGKKFDTIRTDIYIKTISFIQIENSTVDNSTYLSPVDSFELNFIRDIYTYKLKISTKRNAYLFVPDSVTNPILNKLYISNLEEVKALLLNKPQAAECAEQECAFISFGRDNANIISRKAWSALLSNLSKLGIIGREMALSYAKNTPFYDRFKDDFALASNTNACSCSEIKNGIFECNRDCGVEFPYLLSESSKNSPESLFLHRADGLYSLAKSGDDGPMKVSSPIEIIALCREPSGKGWGKIVKLVDPIGEIHTVVLSMADIGSNTETTLRKLMSYGLLLSSHKISKSLILEYLTTYTPNRIATVSNRSGWIGSCYIVKDAVYGNSTDQMFIIDDCENDSPILTRGNLEEWKSNIADLCKDQLILILAISYAFTGFLLTPCGFEGGGLHLFGPSSTGKTTALRVAASVCGGGQGYIKQWRATDNALESIAARHNDGFICLDEIGQATSKVVSEVSYMLTNGQGKARANKDGNAKKVHTWNTNFISTGEITLAESIAVDFGKEVMAGQTVRILDIPADAGSGYGIFSTMPNRMNGHTFSQMLVHNTSLYFGTPAIAFIENFAQDFEKNTEFVKKSVTDFVNNYSPAKSSGQVKRAGQRFGLIATAGELAIQWGILPWTKGDAQRAAIWGYNAWVKQRGGIGDHELSNAIQRLQDFIEKNEGRFISTSSDDRTIVNIVGYKWRDTISHEEVYGILPSVFKNEISRRVNINSIIFELDKNGWICKNSSGNILETKCVAGKNRRVVAVIPERWMAIANLQHKEHDYIDEIY